MALNLATLHHPIGPLTKDYTWRDLILYALGVGAGFDELEYCYEKQLKAIPTFAIAATFDFFWQVGLLANINSRGALHGEQEVIFHHSIPTTGRFITQGAITHIYDKGADKGALVVAQSSTRHSNGQELFTSNWTIFSRLDGGFGGENSPAVHVQMPEAPPDDTASDTPASNQPLLYRLSGDLFDLHVDPQFANSAGFNKPIMHGLCTLGYACRHLIKMICPQQPERLKRLSCRFASPLYPGTPIETQIWQSTVKTVQWQTLSPATGKAVITHGIAEFSGE
jgi:acyl dehydratase